MVKTKPSVHSINLKKPKSTLDKKGLKTKKQAGKIRKGRKKSQRMKREPAGVVYLSHIPHGFYEEQIEAYFGQFGKVTNVSVPRSKSRRAKGFAFIEYKYPEIAKIAADTMNNYLMFNRLLKAKYIPPEQQKPRHFRLAKFARENHRTAADKAELAVKHNRKLKNRHLKIGLEAKLAAKLLKKKNSLIKRAKKLGLDHDFLVEEGNIHSIFETKKEKNALKKIKTNKQENGEAIDSLDENLSSSESADDTLSLGSEDYLLEDIEDSLLESEEEDYEKVISKAKNAAKDILRKIPKHPKNHKPIKGSVAAAPLKALTPQQEEEIMGNNILDSSSLKKSKTLKTPLKVQSSKKEAIVESITINKNVTPKVTKNSKSLSKNVSPLIEKTPSSVKKVRASSQTSSNKKSNISQVVMEVDNNDEEIDFKTPPNVIKKFIKTEKESMKKSFKENTINQSSLTPKKPDSTKKTPKKLDSTTKTPKEGKSKISSPTSSGKKVRHRHLKHLTP